MKRDQSNVGWTQNREPLNKPDLTQRDSQPVAIPFCPDCHQPMSLCECDH